MGGRSFDKAKLTNKFSRPKTNFSTDPCVLADGEPDPDDYVGTADKLQIGHMAPSEDFNNSDVNMRDTFVFSNAVPQGGATFNAAIWHSLELQVRKAVIARNRINVITGPVRGDGVNRTINIARADNACGGAIELDAFNTKIVCKAVNKNTAATCTTGVVVPVALYKIAYDSQKNAAYAFLMANRNYQTRLGKAFMEESRVNVGVIEKLTGLKFFAALPADKRAALVNNCEHCGRRRRQQRKTELIKRFHRPVRICETRKTHRPRSARSRRPGSRSMGPSGRRRKRPRTPAA